MTDQELKELNQKLWHAADQLRAGAHLSANRYGQPARYMHRHNASGEVVEAKKLEAEIAANAKGLFGAGLGRLRQLGRLGRGRNGLSCRRCLSNRGREAR